VDCHERERARNDGGGGHEKAKLKYAKDKTNHPTLRAPLHRGELTLNLQDFSVSFSHDNEAQTEARERCVLEVRERARRICNDVSVSKNELKIVKDEVRRFYKEQRSEVKISVNGGF
jgi:hypothetical protein